MWARVKKGRLRHSWFWSDGGWVSRCERAKFSELAIDFMADLKPKCKDCEQIERCAPAIPVASDTLRPSK